MTKIFIPIEISAREFEWKKSLAKICQDQGYAVILGYKPLVQELALSDNQGIYLDKGYHPIQSDKLYKKLKKKKFTIISIDEEGAIDWNNGCSLATRYPPKLTDLIDYIFLWGKQQKFLYYNNCDKALITGHPRFNLKKNIINKRNIISEKNNKILIVTNASFGNNKQGREAVLSRYKSRINNLNEILDLDIKKVGAVNAVLSIIPKNISVILRIHPEECTSSYVGVEENIEFSSKSLSEDLQSCNTVLHFDSTVAIDAIRFNADVITMIKLISDPNSPFVCGLPVLISDYALNDYDEIQKILRENKTFPEKEKYKIIEDYFYETNMFDFSNELIKCINDNHINKKSLSFKQYLIIFKFYLNIIFGRIDKISLAKYFSHFGNTKSIIDKMKRILIEI